MLPWLIGGAIVVGAAVAYLRSRNVNKIPRVTLAPDVLERSKRRAAASATQLAPLRAVFDRAGVASGFPANIIRAIAMTETNGQNIDGDGGHGNGMMQIDDRSFATWIAAWKAGGRKVEDNILKGADVLRAKRESLKALVPGLSGDDLTYAAIAAYNTGEGNVSKSLWMVPPRSPDATSTGGHYAASVLETARWMT